MKRRAFISFASSSLFLASMSSFVVAKGEEIMSLTYKWDKVFPESDKVNHRKVTFRTRFGTTLVGDLYEPKDARGDLPAIAVCGPFGAVKEQSSGLYAQQLAENGFIALAFDPSFTGESSGFPRGLASPDINTEDFSAAVDFLSNLKDVNKDKIGILGICGWGGLALNTAAIDTRVKATVTSTMYNMSRLYSRGYFDQMDETAREHLRQQLNEQRTKDFAAGTYAPAAGLPEKLKGDEPLFVKHYWEYYKTPRGFHPRSINSNGAWNETMQLSFMNTPLLTYAGEIKAPVLMIHGADAHSLYFSQDAYKLLKGDNKRLLIVPNANHTDLYDNMNKIPFAEIVKFFKENLK